MKIKIKHRVFIGKTFDCIEYYLEVTEADILDYIQLKSLFNVPDHDIGLWEKFCLKNEIYSFGSSFNNIKSDSFDIVVTDTPEFDQKIIDLIDQYLEMNNL